MSSLKEKILSPEKFDEIICKDIIFPSNSIVSKMIENNDLFSILFFGNPGVGKSLSVEYILKKLNKEYFYFNSSSDNKEKLSEFLHASKYGKPIIIIEEIHRLNKDKQDLLLMYLEKKLITVFATTTENPFFKVNPAIRSRMFLYKIENIEPKILKEEIIKYLSKNNIKISNRVVETIVDCCKSDFRQIDFYLNVALSYYENDDEDTIIKQLTKIYSSNIDNKQTNHYDIVSAFHKSIRGSDPDAALYYLGLLLENGDLISIYRRLYCVVYEDIGLANSSLGPKVHAAIEASEFLGLPEAMLPLSNITVELALSPKSNSTYEAISNTLNEIKKGYFPPPHHIRDNHYKSCVKLGVEGYLYPHNYKFHYVKQEYLPKELKNKKFYNPDKYNKIETKLQQYWNEIKK